MASKSGGGWSHGGEAVIAREATSSTEMGKETLWLLSSLALQSPTRASHWSGGWLTAEPGKRSLQVSRAGAGAWRSVRGSENRPQILSDALVNPCKLLGRKRLY